MQENKKNFLKAYQLAKADKTHINVIGIQQEKILHKTIKYYLSNDSIKHEIKIAKSASSFIYVDVLSNGMIYEVQTANFNKLREKLTFLLDKYPLTIVYPLAHNKTIYKIETLGTISSSRKSPKVGNIFDAFKELYKIKFCLKHPNLKIKILLIDVDEYREVILKKHIRSKGYLKLIQVPKDLFLEIDLNNQIDYQNILLELNLKKQFTSSDFAKSARITNQKARVALNILLYLGIIKKIGKIKNSFLYEKINKKVV